MPRSRYAVFCGTLLLAVTAGTAANCYDAFVKPPLPAEWAGRVQPGQSWECKAATDAEYTKCAVVQEDTAGALRMVLGPRYYNQQGEYLCDRFPCPARAEPPAQAVDATATAPATEGLEGPSIEPYFKQGFASDAEVRAAVGAVSLSMDHCEQTHSFDDDRIVRVTVRRPNIEQPGVLDALLSKAAHFAWQSCPRPYTRSSLGGAPTGDYHYDLKQVVIYGRDGSRLFEATLGGTLRGDGFLSSGDQYRWNEVENYVAHQRQQAEQAAAQAATQQVQAYQASVRAEDNRRGMAKFWGWVRLILLGVFLLWVVVNWEMLLRWYYSLRPHPATSIVESAIYSGREIDGDLYERILRPVPGSRIEKQVRAGQAQDLTSQLRTHEAALRSEEARVVEAERRRVEQENAFSRAHAELLRAGVDHEVAAARVDELRKATRRS